MGCCVSFGIDGGGVRCSVESIEKCDSGTRSMLMRGRFLGGTLTSFGFRGRFRHLGAVVGVYGSQEYKSDRNEEEPLTWCPLGGSGRVLFLVEVRRVLIFEYDRRRVFATLLNREGRSVVHIWNSKR